MEKLDQTQQAARDQFQKQSANYGKTHILANVDDVAAALNPVIRPENGQALDIATGGGHTALYLASEGWQVTAADITPAMLENTAKLARERGLELKMALHKAEELPYAEGSFDLVTCRVAAHHFSSREKFVSESFRVLRPGGYFLLIDGSIPDDNGEAEEWIHQVEKLRDPSHGRFLAPKAWARLCEENGLEVLRCETTPFKQPDLEWYFETAATTVENREKVRRLITNAPESARTVFHLGEEDGKTVWWWLRMSLLARKP